jgi:hypothetical protein
MNYNSFIRAHVCMIVFFFATLTLFAPTAFAASDITGKWDSTVNLGGNSGSPSFTFKQDGEKLSGSYSGLFGEAALTGTVKGSAVNFDFEVSGTKIHYEGKVSDDGKTIEGTCDYGGNAGKFTATRAATPTNEPQRPNAAGTLDQVTTKGAVLTINGFDVDFIFMPDHRFEALSGMLEGS